MKIFKTKSFSPLITDDELEFDSVRTTTFISFERAIAELNNPPQQIKGYQVTEQGIILILEEL